MHDIHYRDGKVTEPENAKYYVNHLVIDVVGNGFVVAAQFNGPVQPEINVADTPARMKKILKRYVEELAQDYADRNHKS